MNHKHPRETGFQFSLYLHDCMQTGKGQQFEIVHVLRTAFDVGPVCALQLDAPATAAGACPDADGAGDADDGAGDVPGVAEGEVVCSVCCAAWFRFSASSFGPIMKYCQPTMTRNESAIAMMTFWLFFTGRFSERRHLAPNWGSRRPAARLLRELP